MKTLATALAVLAALAPISVHALSCAPPNIGRGFNHLVDQGRKPVVMVAIPIPTPVTAPETGKRNLLDLKTPQTTSNPEPVTNDQILVGTAFGADGTDRPTKITASITVECVLNWCGSMPTDGKARLFLLWQEDGQHKTMIGPCGGGSFAPPNTNQRAALKRCIANGQCSDDDLDTLEANWD